MGKKGVLSPSPMWIRKRGDAKIDRESRTSSVAEKKVRGDLCLASPTSGCVPHLRLRPPPQAASPTSGCVPHLRRRPPPQAASPTSGCVPHPPALSSSARFDKATAPPPPRSSVFRLHVCVCWNRRIERRSHITDSPPRRPFQSRSPWTLLR